MNEAKDCPFCGGDPYLETKWDASKEITFMYMKCKKCGASGKAYSNSIRIYEYDDIYKKCLWETANMAVDAWNWRAKE